MAQIRLHAATRSRTGVVASLALGAAAAGCSTSPLTPSVLDYDRRIAPERLRQVDTFSLPEAAPDEREPAERAAGRFEGLERVDLSIEEVRAETLANNLDLRVALVDPLIAAESVSEEEGRFDAVFGVSASWLELDGAVASELDSQRSRNQSVRPSVRVPLRTGGTGEIRLPVTRRETDNRFAILDPAYTTNLELSLSHPLLRGAGRRATMHGLRIADLNRQSAEGRTKLEIIRQLAAADRSYWRLYAAQRALEVRWQQYEVAVEQLEGARRRLDVGAGPEIDVLRAESGVAERVEAVIVAQNEVLLRQRELKRIANIRGLDIDSAAWIVPVSDPDPVPYDVDAETLARAAVENRMEMLELEIRLAADEAQIAFDRNQALPLLAMSYTYRVNGLGGTFEDSFDLMRENRFADWELGLTAEVPLGNNERRARVARSVLTRLQRLSTREARAQAIRQEVYDAADQIGSGWQRVVAAQQAVLLASRTLDAERRQFNVGRSTSTDVLDADARLAEARLAEIRALVDYQIAQVDLAFATGTLLGAAKVRWEPTRPSRSEAEGAWRGAGTE